MFGIPLTALREITVKYVHLKCLDRWTKSGSENGLSGALWGRPSLALEPARLLHWRIRCELCSSIYRLKHVQRRMIGRIAILVLIAAMAVVSLLTPLRFIHKVLVATGNDETPLTLGRPPSQYPDMSALFPTLSSSLMSSTHLVSIGGESILCFFEAQREMEGGAHGLTTYCIEVSK
mmetsp:Transcript_12772/g.25904  ORF Transcript_12772/g.25904 Transcript_12772/m.25904 type:complete len:177 (+) Transcript_12772:378-908(+)